MSSSAIFAIQTIAGVQSPALLAPNVKEAIVTAFWPYLDQHRISLLEYSAYFTYFRMTIGKLIFGERYINTQIFAAQTPEEVGEMVKCIREHGDKPREAVMTEMQKKFPNSDEAQINHSLELVSRLWLTVHITSTKCRIGPTGSEVTPVPWEDSVSLRATISNCFRKSELMPTFREARIDPGFTMANLSYICGIQVRWTDNLKDHLAYDRLMDVVWIYPHKICLVNHQGGGIFSDDFLIETLRTLDLLFPMDKSTKTYLEKAGHTFNRTHTHYARRAEDITEFHYWRKAVAELHDVFNRTPSKPYQLWHDRRNPMQWWTFWLAALIALLTVVFGIISSYIAFKQAALSEVANQLSEKSYRLSILQACAQNSSFCHLQLRLAI
jgi:hypothetical protein